MSEQEVPWEGQCADAAYQFALRCAVLVTQNPGHTPPPLEYIINTVMTELWDRNFSQSDIRAAFESAVEDLPRYTAGEERRSSTSTQLATTDWQAKTTYFGLWSAKKIQEAAGLLRGLGVRFEIQEYAADREVLAEWEAWDPSVQNPNIGFDLWIATDDLPKVGDAIVERFPERRFEPR